MTLLSLGGLAPTCGVLPDGETLIVDTAEIATVAERSSDLREAEAHVWRLAAGPFEGALRASADAITLGLLDTDHVLVTALILRRVREHGKGLDGKPQQVARQVVDDASLEDLLLAPGVDVALGGDRCPGLSDELSHVLAIVREQVQDASRGGFMASAIARREGTTVAEAERNLRLLTLRALPSRETGKPWSRAEDRARGRARAAMVEAPWPDGRGRRSGAEGKRTTERRTDLYERLRGELTEDELVELCLDGRRPACLARYAQEWGIALSTASSDWRNSVRPKIAREVGYLTPYVLAQASGNRALIARERKRVRRLEHRLNVGVGSVRAPICRGLSV